MCAYQLGNMTKTHLYTSVTADLSKNANFAFDVTGNIGSKTLDNVATMADLWSWVRLGLIPVIFKDRYPFSETTHNDPTGSGCLLEGFPAHNTSCETSVAKTVEFTLPAF